MLKESGTSSAGNTEAAALKQHKATQPFLTLDSEPRGAGHAVSMRSASVGVSMMFSSPLGRATTFSEAGNPSAFYSFEIRLNGDEVPCKRGASVYFRMGQHGVV